MVTKEDLKCKGLMESETEYVDMNYKLADCFPFAQLHTHINFSIFFSFKRLNNICMSEREVSLKVKHEGTNLCVP